MLAEAMVVLARFLHGIYVGYGPTQVTQVVEQLVINLPCDGMSFGHRKVRCHRYVDLGVEFVSRPPRPHLCHVLYPRHFARRMPDLAYHRRLYPVEEAGEDALAALPDNDYDCRSDEQPHEGIGERV